MHTPMSNRRPILTITGSDSTGYSGIQADIKTISALGGHAVTAVTSVTVQTSLGIQEFYDLPSSIVEGQIEAVMNDVEPEVVKIGMIRTCETLDVILKILRKYRPKHVIYDPIVHSSQGDALMSETLLSDVLEKLLPLTTEIVRLDDVNLHGLKNVYSSALAVFLNNGDSTPEARTKAMEYVNSQIAHDYGQQGRASDLYVRFMDEVTANVGRKNVVQYYADKLNVSARYLAQVTRKISDKSPKTIIDDHLAQKIEILLKTTDKTVQEIAYECGFSSQAHLSNFFKKTRGNSPTKYRKL